MPIEIKSNGVFKNIQKRLEQQQNKKLEVGFFEPKIATIAMYLEYGWVQRITANQVKFFHGAHSIHLVEGNTLYMPPRPFMRGTFAVNQKEWAQKAKKWFVQTMDIERSLDLLGVTVQEEIQQSILTGSDGKQKFEPRSELTMKLIQTGLSGHKTNGTPNTSNTSQPLNRTGKLKASVTYRVS